VTQIDDPAARDPARTVAAKPRGSRRLLKLALQKPELAAALLLALLVVFFQVRSDGVFLNYDNLRGMLGLFPEVALVAVGVTLLMICGEFDLSVGSVFALMPMTMAVLMTGGWPFWAAVGVGSCLRGDRLRERLRHDPLRHPVLHHHARA
jgi:simple sugar transport system permease protein